MTQKLYEGKQTAGYVVGRNQEIKLFKRIINDKSPYTIFNIYGPGGIGKTIVCNKFEAWCSKEQVPYATVRGDALVDATFEKLLKEFRKGLQNNLPKLVSKRVFKEFDKKLDGYLKLKDVKNGGEINKVFDLAGKLVDQAPLKAALEVLRGTYERIEEHLAHRDAFERYMDGADIWLIKSFVKGIEDIIERSEKVILLIDTYESMLDWDRWLCNSFVKHLPPGTKVVILGRDRLSLDWNENYGERVHGHELQELSEEDAKKYLRHFGLRDEASLNRVYAFTGGYPLCLMLAVELAKGNDGMDWNKVQGFQNIADRAQVASQLLERILKQTAVREVKDFLEKGVVVEWFDPEAVSYILGLNPEHGVEIYEKIERFSFVQRHPQGLKFHDRIRELLMDRLRFNSKDQYRDLIERWRIYLRRKAGV